MFKIQILIVVCSVLALSSAKNVDVKKAIVKLIPVAGQTVTGIISFEQTSDGVNVDGNFENLSPSTSHGLIVHSFGDVTGDFCASVGDHFNPHKKSHGGRTNSKSTRHVGDLGNVDVDSEGKAAFKFTDKVISLNGEDRIVGKAVVIHNNKDDLGKGDNDQSKKDGNVGGLLACGVVGVSENGSSAVVPTIVTFVVVILLNCCNIFK